MYYKVMKDNAVLDVLDSIKYAQYQTKHKTFLFCNVSEAQGIFSSDGKIVWHISGLHDIPIEGYDTVELIEISFDEYQSRKQLNGQTKE